MLQMVERSLFALKLLPHDACPVVVILTDGVSAPHDMLGSAQYDSLLMQLLRHDIPCHVVQVGCGEDPNDVAFGYVADPEALGFLCGATGGVLRFAPGG